MVKESQFYDSSIHTIPTMPTIKKITESQFYDSSIHTKF